MNHSCNSFIFTFLVIILFAACASQKPAVPPQATASVGVSDASATVTTPPEPREYLIQPGDQLDIKFFYNPEINESVTVRPDGKISLQLVDEVQAAGLKPSQLDKVLTEKYAYELKKPVITVIVKSFGGQRIYVGGEVNRQGLLTLTGAMTPLQAVLNAGGFRETANPASAIVIRKGLDNHPVPIRMNLKEVMQGQSESANFLLQPDDIVYIPKTTIAKANKFVNQYIENLLLFKGVSLGFSYQTNTYRE